MQTKLPYCLPIIVTKQRDILAKIAENPDYDFYEIWLDYLDDFNITFVEKLIETYEEKLLILFRRKDLAPTKLSFKEKQTVMQLVANKKCFLDLDISQTEELAFVKQEKLKINLICSYHNYNQTSDDKSLREILEKIANYDPTISKIATYCTNENDAVRLLKILVKLKSENKQYIILGMGEFGTITRIAGALWGNAINFAPKTIEETTAPGQLTKAEIETIFGVLITK